MSSSTKKAGSALSLLSSAADLIGTIVAFVKTPAFIGWAGFGKSMLVGTWAGFATGAIGLVGAIAGAIAGAVVSLPARLVGAPKSVTAGLMLVGGYLGMIAGAGYGAVQGYNEAKGWLVNPVQEKSAAVWDGSSQKSFNKVSANDNKTIVLTVKNFKPAAKIKNPTI